MEEKELFKAVLKELGYNNLPKQVSQLIKEFSVLYPNNPERVIDITIRTQDHLELINLLRKEVV